MEILERSLVVFLALLLSYPSPLLAQESMDDWPKEITAGEYLVTIYSPENSSYVDLRLEANFAFSVKKGSDGAPVFGMMWTTSLLDADRDNRIASLVSVTVDEVRFPDDVSDEDEERFKTLIENEVPKWDIQFELEDLIESMEEVSTYQAEMDNSPPKILFSTIPTVLIMIDGDPKFKEADNRYEVIQNSGSFIAYDSKSNTYYLLGGEFWYESDSALGPWENIKKAPSKVRKLADQAKSDLADQDQEEDDPYDGIAPGIMVSTEPAELILIEGEADFSPLQNTQLLYVKNSDDDLFMDIESQSYFVLISGRWFTSSSLDGPWEYRSSDELPAGFKAISPESEKGDVLANVAGTEQANDAILDAQIPQTAEVDRSTKASEVVYNGSPEFKNIEGLSLQYAVNTESSVFKDGNSFYLCDNAIWFEASSPNGPWSVSEDRPDEISQIPPDNPKYNTKYVYIYESTPTVVYMGYTPGYHGCYVHGNTIVYGTGFYYNPWYNGYYYHHHYTYGFSVRYNPWYGWSFGFSFGSPYGWRGYGYWGYHSHWGPPFYRPPYYRPGYRPRPTPYIYGRHRPGVRPYQRPTQLPAGTRPGVRPGQPTTRPNVPGTRPGTRPSPRPETRPSPRPETRPTPRPETRPSPRPETRPTPRPNVPSTRPATRPQTRPSPPMNRPTARPARPVARPAPRPAPRGRRN